MKEKYFSYKYLISFLILFTCLFIFSAPSLALIPGDFGSEGGGAPDGCVDFEDLMIFAMAYGSTPPDDNWNLLCDIYPDGIIDFEDLMIFAMHYGECECILPPAPTLSDPGTALPSSATYAVSWSSVSGATSYVLQEATSSDFTSGLQEYSVTDTSKSFSHTVTTTTTYYYRVAAVNDCGQSDWSNVEDIDIVTCSSPPVTEVTALGFTYHSSYMSVVQSIINKLIKENRIHESYPIVPKKIERIDVAYEIYVEWAEYTEDKPDGYKVYKSIDGASYQLIVEGYADPGYGYYSFTDTTVTEGSTYSYYITAYDTGWETCPSQPAITTVLPWCSLASPLNGVTIKNNPNPDFSWSPVGVSTFPYGSISYGDSDLRVKDTTTSGESWYILFNNLTVSTATYDQDGQAIPLVSGHSYTWNSCGYGYDEKGGNLIAISCSEDWGFDYCTAPSPPILSDPGTTLPAPANYTVSWTAVSGATSYVLQEATSSNFTSGLQEYSVTNTIKSFSHTVITTYYYRVAAINDCGQGSWSNIVDIEICPCTPPSPPTLSDPGTTLPSPVTYTVNWSSVSGAKNYVLQEATSFDFTSCFQEYTLFGTSKSFSYTVSTTTTYYYQVAAINDCGQSGWSNIQDVTVAIDPVHNLTKDTYYNTIQAALDDADNDNIIEVPDGTYDESITFPSVKKITLQSVNGASSTTIRGNDGSPTVTFHTSLEDTTLEGFTITHNSGENGRGIDISEGFLIIDNCTISANTAPTYGGGIYNQGGILTITASTTISGNASGLGGGIYNNGGTLTITSSSDISGNTTITDGGGIYNNGTLNITSSSTISGNTADDSGGGIYNNGTLTITSSTISGNTAADYGGGIYNFDGISTITSSDISSNTADDSGGGIYNNGGTLTITSSSTISGNTADERGGGIYNWNGTLTITGSTIFSNTAVNRGGGIYNNGTLNITSSTISGNTADYGGGIYNGIGSTLDITSSIISSNDVTGSGGGIFINISTITIGGNHYLDFNNFNTFTDNKKDGIISAYQHIRDSSGDCHSSYPNNFYNPN